MSRPFRLGGIIAGLVLATGHSYKIVTAETTVAAGKTLADQVCSKLKRNMNPDEWDKYVGNGVPYESTCKSILINNF